MRVSGVSWLVIVVLSAALGSLGGGTAAQQIRTEQVTFAAGETGTTISDTITGYGSVSYLVGAEAGQTLSVELSPSNAATFFNLYAPGQGPGDAALAVGGMLGPTMPEINRFEGEVPISGIYTVSVYMMRSAARRGERSDFTLGIAITGGGPDAEPIVTNDFADGLQGGPDFWEVRAVGAAGRVNLRAQPSTGAAVLGTAANGTVLRNLGCRMAEARRWCRIETLKAPVVSGWTAGDFLIEGQVAAEDEHVAPPQPSSIPETRGERVEPVPGATAIRCETRLSGGEAVNYTIPAHAGQTLSVNLLTEDPATHYSIFAPDGALLYDSFGAGDDRNRFSGPLPASGDYVVTVYYLGQGTSQIAIEFGIE